MTKTAFLNSGIRVLIWGYLGFYEGLKSTYKGFILKPYFCFLPLSRNIKQKNLTLIPYLNKK
jgi:hypothetical protein